MNLVIYLELGDYKESSPPRLGAHSDWALNLALDV